MFSTVRDVSHAIAFKRMCALVRSALPGPECKLRAVLLAQIFTVPLKDAEKYIDHVELDP